MAWNKEKPILFSTPMVQAILDGRKTQTRRVIKVPTDHVYNGLVVSTTARPKRKYIDRYHFQHPMFPKILNYYEGYENDENLQPSQYFIKPKYTIGDILWVRETWQLLPSGFDGIPPEKNYIYRATHELSDECTAWRPSIFMPREAARIFLRVTGVRMERLLDITEQDAKAEGVTPLGNPVDPDAGTSYRLGFSLLWDDINAKRGFSWDDNPWVNVVDFERVGNPKEANRVE